MTSKLVAQLVEREGLAPLLEMRERGEVPAEADVLALAARAEILALGAAADVARRLECGDETRIYIPGAPPASDTIVVVGSGVAERGTAFLRHIAALRLAGSIGRRIVIDFGALGLEIGQVALSFGATDLAGPIASRKGLPLLDKDDQKKLVKRREIAGYVERAGFRPVFVEARAVPQPRAHADS
jgi:hypothetical protein